MLDELGIRLEVAWNVRPHTVPASVERKESD